MQKRFPHLLSAQQDQTHNHYVNVSSYRSVLKQGGDLHGEERKKNGKRGGNEMTGGLGERWTEKYPDVKTREENERKNG